MGVVHKLKKEVIDFVLHQKRKAPALSCRQMAVFTSERFKIQVSKSSVNTIMKNARLSSSVGRRASLQKIPKKFQIPSQKKRQLLEDIRKSGGHLPQTTGRAESEVSVSSQGTVLKKKTGVQSPPAHSPREAAVTDEGVQTIAQKGPLCEGMGLIFLKAAEWELSGGFVLGKLLRKYIPDRFRGGIPAGQAAFDEICEWLLYSRIFSADRLEDLRALKDHGLWALNISTPTAGEFLSWDWVQEIPFPEAFGMEYASIKEQLLAEVVCFKIYLEDGTELTMDPRLSVLWEGDVPFEFFSPMEKAMTTLSRRIISNNSPAVFWGLSAALLLEGSAQEGGPLFDMIALFEGDRGRKMKKAVVVGLHNNPLAEFSVFPDKKRHFLVGLRPRQKEFEVVREEARAKPFRHFYHPGLGQTFYWQELNMNFGARTLRIIAVSGEEGADPQVAIMTNWREAKAQKVIEEFFLRWPDLEKSPAFFSGRLSPDILGGDDFGDSLGGGGLGINFRDVFQILDDFIGELNKFCRKCYFRHAPVQCNTTDMFAAYYNIPGYYVRSQDVLKVVLKPPANYAHRESLRQAAARLNESAVTDPSGRRLLAEIEF